MNIETFEKCEHFLHIYVQREAQLQLIGKMICYLPLPMLWREAKLLEETNSSLNNSFTEETEISVCYLPTCQLLSDK